MATDEQPRPLPLAGVTVLDLGQIYQGPYAGFLMAMSGARVIKVEPRIGETLRVRGPSLAMAMINSNKESVCLDLKHEQGLDVFNKLVANADVVLMNYAPGVPERLGIGYEALSAINQRLIVAHAAGFGVRDLDGEVTTSTIPAMDITVQAHMGSMMITGNEGQPPVKAGPTFIDFLGGTHLYGAITTALYERERTGVGRSVEVAMADTAYFTLATALNQWHQTGSTLRTGNRHAGLSLAPYNVYECADGYVAVITAANRHWRSMIEVMGRQDLETDPRFANVGERGRHIEEIDEIVEAWTTTLPRQEVAQRLQQAHVPAAVVRIVDEVVRDEVQHARKGLQWIDHPELGTVPLPHSPIRWHGSDLVELESSPLLGADNHVVYREVAGLSADDISALEQEGVISKKDLS